MRPESQVFQAEREDELLKEEGKGAAAAGRPEIGGVLRMRGALTHRMRGGLESQQGRGMMSPYHTARWGSPQRWERAGGGVCCGLGVGVERSRAIGGRTGWYLVRTCSVSGE